MSPLWRLDGVKAELGGRPILRGVSLAVAAGEVVGAIGANGAGKTTLLRAGLGLTPLTAGQAWLGERPLGEMSAADRARRVGYLPQERRIGWNLAAGRIVELGAPDLPEGEARAVAAACLARVGLDRFEDRGVLDLSGGERARVLLARLLATRAPLLVADEPAAGLDPDAQLLALDLLREEAARGAGVVLTLHDLGLAARSCNRLVVLAKGKVVADGPPREVLVPAVMREAFGVEGALVETEAGLVFTARRL
ncbi:MAG: ATP-binding cassette domain-containing protein [Caulobacter sp.]|nr:ATP-binding cassette domain-containing protein [Caulobacter sp.]